LVLVSLVVAGLMWYKNARIATALADGSQIVEALSAMRDRDGALPSNLMGIDPKLSKEWNYDASSGYIILSKYVWYGRLSLHFREKGSDFPFNGWFLSKDGEPQPL